MGMSITNIWSHFRLSCLLSPLRSSPVHIFATSNSLHSYARPPQASSAPSPARSHMRERRRVRVQPFTPTSQRKHPHIHTYGTICTVYVTFMSLWMTPPHLPFHPLQAISESESGSFCMSSLSDDDDMGWSHSWPSTVWHCFLKGTEWHDYMAPLKQIHTRGDTLNWQRRCVVTNWIFFYLHSCL